MNHLIAAEITGTQSRRRPRGRRGDFTIRKANLPICRATGHIRYRDNAQAREALNSANWQRAADLITFGDSNRREVRIFRCTDSVCNGGYHLTSRATWHEAVPSTEPALT